MENNSTENNKINPTPLEGTSPKETIPQVSTPSFTTGAFVQKPSNEAHISLNEAPTQEEGNHPSIPSLRTLADDMKNVIQKENVSMVKMVVAEQKRRQLQGDETIEDMEPESKGKNMLLIVSGIFFILFGLGIAGYLVFQHQQATQPVAVPDYKSAIIKVESKTIIATDKMFRRDLIDRMSSLRASTISLNSVQEINFTKTSASSTEVLSSQEFLDKMETRVPAILYRTLTPTFVTAIHSFEGNQTFLVFKTTSFEQTYSGMLEWEKTLDADLGPLFYDSITEATATSSKQIIDKKGFVDEILYNKDVRILRTSDGRIKLLYSLVDPTTVVITTNKFTLQEAIERLKIAKLIR